jgi:F0F1-type ATP synthase assembly protein I
MQPFELISSLSSSGRRSQRNDGEQKRQLWERKQAELEARWVLAQSRQAEQDSARHRKWKIAFTVIGTTLAGLLCVLAWYFARENIHIGT